MRPILPPAMLGIIGGGQLGRMFTMSARSMGYRVTVLEPDPQCPAGTLADVHLCAAYDDQQALDQLAQTCSAVTTEFENVSAQGLQYLAQSIRVSPSAESVSIAQDRIREKTFVQNAGLAVAPFARIESLEDLSPTLTSLLPGILKLAQLGYDGKGQVSVDSLESVREGFMAMGQKACVLEQRLDLDVELSVIVARTSASEVTTFPVAENQHDAGILDVSLAPARITQDIAQKARNMALQLAEALDYVGVLAIEFFLLKDQRLIVNEMAPRPHNSGHFSLDATLTSQFEQQVRTLCGLPPGDTRLLSQVVMINLLGDLWGDQAPEWSILLEQPNVLLHLYGKTSARPGRKMGHFNVLGEDIEEVLHQATSLRDQLRRSGH